MLIKWLQHDHPGGLAGSPSPCLQASLSSLCMRGRAEQHSASCQHCSLAGREEEPAAWPRGLQGPLTQKHSGPQVGPQEERKEASLHTCCILKSGPKILSLLEASRSTFPLFKYLISQPGSRVFVNFLLLRCHAAGFLGNACKH